MSCRMGQTIVLRVVFEVLIDCFALRSTIYEFTSNYDEVDARIPSINSKPSVVCRREVSDPSKIRGMLLCIEQWNSETFMNLSVRNEANIS